MVIITTKGFNSKRNIRQCQRCKNIIRETFNPENSKWECPLCGTPTPKRKKRNIKDKEDVKTYNRTKQREHRKRWPVECRRGDHKKGTGWIGSKPKSDSEDEVNEIIKEFKRLGLEKASSSRILVGK